MTRYEFLCAKIESGELKEWYPYGVSPHLLSWKEIYEYHLLFPELSQVQIAGDLRTSKSKVQRALEFMNQEHT
ncbi:MAG: hypothetical protein IK073_04900 [Paludibacteraceae bacterium]|nr:hypothetical protein [Paludibacteraceae bacterium]